MKRLLCLLLVVSIACAGCYETEIDKLNGKSLYDTDSEYLKSHKELREEIVKLERDIRKLKAMPKPDKVLLARIAELESSLESQRVKLRTNIAKLESELSKLRAMPEQNEALRARIAELEIVLESQGAEERAEKALMLRIDDHEDTINSAMVALTTDLLVRIDELEDALELLWAKERAENVLPVRIAELEAAIELQRAEIENSKNMSRVYEVAVESQRLTIETLQKLCRLYEAEKEFQGKSRRGEESPLDEEPSIPRRR